MNSDLIAPCGMNCRLCSGFIRKVKPCPGCRSSADNKPAYCTSCAIVHCAKRLSNQWSDCSACDVPCRRLKTLDKRYRTKYHMSMLENLAMIRDEGMDRFLDEQQRRFRCPVCGGTPSVHRTKCPVCQHELTWEGLP